MSTFSVRPFALTHAFDNTPFELDFVLPGFLAGTVGGLVAQGGTGKSFFSLALAMDVATSGQRAKADLLGLNCVAGGRTVLIAGEDPAAALHQRVHAIGAHLSPVARMAVAGNLEVYPVVGKRLDIENPEHYAWLERTATGARLMIIDTLARVHRRDENQTGEAKAVMQVLEELASSTGCAILYVHHVSKAAALGGLSDLQQAARGSGVFVDHARWLAFVATMSADEAKALGVDTADRQRYVRFNVSKQNYSESVPDRWFKRHEGGVLLPHAFGSPTLPRAVRSAKPATAIKRRGADLFPGATQE